MGQPAGLLMRSSPPVTSQPCPPSAFGFHHQRHQTASASAASASAALTAGPVLWLQKLHCSSPVRRLSTLSAFSHCCSGDSLMATTSGCRPRSLHSSFTSSAGNGDFGTGLSSSGNGDFGRGFSAGQKLRQSGPLTGSGGRHVVTMALPIDAYWITAAQAVAVAGLMGGIAALTGVFINIRIEVQALAEFKELEEKGLLPDEISVPDGNFDLEAPLYIFQSKEFSSAGTPRNRPIREEFQPELEKELKTELINRPIREEFQPELEKELKTELVETSSKE